MMPIQKQITCTNKRGGHYNPHERIADIGGSYLGANWKLPLNVAIFNIKNQIEDYYVRVNNEPVFVVIARHDGKEYLKTEIDAYKPEYLLNLPECS